MARQNDFNEYEQREYTQLQLDWYLVRDLYQVNFNEYKEWVRAKYAEKNDKLTLIDFLGRTRGANWWKDKVAKDETEVREWLASS